MSQVQSHTTRDSHTVRDLVKSPQTLLNKVSDNLPDMSMGQKAAAAGLGIAFAAAAGVMAHQVRKGALSNGDADVDKVFHLGPEGEAWVLTLEGSTGTEARFETKEEGLEVARELAKSNTPSELVIHLMDGSEQRRHRYGVE